MYNWSVERGKRGHLTASLLIFKSLEQWKNVSGMKIHNVYLQTYGLFHILCFIKGFSVLVDGTQEEVVVEA